MLKEPRPITTSELIPRICNRIRNSDELNFSALQLTQINIIIQNEANDYLSEKATELLGGPREVHSS